ncbi:MAG: Nif11-like leader peptide family RiPP precursor [Actinomycetota bacterium]
MSVELATELVRRVHSDPEFRQRLQTADPADRRAILLDQGYGDIRLSHVSQALPQSSGGELSDEEFAAVAGAGTTSDVVSGIGVTMVAAAAAAA